MHAPPADPVAAVGMLDALDQAADVLGVTAEGAVRWAAAGHVVGRRVRCGRGTAWLAVRAVPLGEAGGILWHGNATAEKAFGDLAGVRPALLNLYDRTDGGTAYRAELTACPDEPRCSPTPAPSPDLAPADRWWATLRRTVETVARAATDRVAVDRQAVDAVPRVLGLPAPHIERFAPAHADLHWANLTAHGPHILGWEGWGLAPEGYDAATLHACSLVNPGLAARVRVEFPVLDTESGRAAEVVAVARLIAAVAPDTDPALSDALRARARELRARASR
ncbi:hypothetical protein LO772_12995 [Yinghuangia sp. ASG 101]|uniref:hypothetical protein n=1 Tax=Yinghuangia sp. ASG 101 TaxID=2896848 RepID=UPI001E283877|nr:hypothetical protein [Yinghuangia sp. ASG 101]UGQ14419.1 hypothetical protein LO772_12995 [Yinghuangia sp. ASG 101]